MRERLLAFLRWPRAKKGLYHSQCLLRGRGQLWLPSEAPTTGMPNLRPLLETLFQWVGSALRLTDFLLQSGQFQSPSCSLLFEKQNLQAEGDKAPTGLGD